MTESYRDIEGPITIYVKIIIKPEYVDDFSKFVTEYAQAYRTRSTSCDVVCYENVFVCWEKFTGPDVVEKTTLIEFINAKDKILKWTAEEPEFKFFATNSVMPA